jgi:ATP diphosphatase
MSTSSIAVSHEDLVKVLRASVKPSGGPSNGGLDNHMWAAVCDRAGVVQAVCYTGSNVADQWPGSRSIAIEKANTANALSLPGFAFSTANLYSGAQPGGFLFGILTTNPVDTASMYAGEGASYGTAQDPMVGRKASGVVVFGGGVALYNGHTIVGALGVSGDTSCADHNVAWRVRSRKDRSAPAWANEVAGAIEDKDWTGLKDELGDLLLQVVYHARMAEEAGLFAFGDVVQAITTKMISRHPHVFGDGAAEADATAQKQTWEALKSGERRAKGKGRVLDDVSRALPALLRAEKLQKRLSTVGFDWNSPKLVLDKVAEEAREIVEAHESGASHQEVEGEIGDLLFVIANLARHLKVDPEAALRVTNAKVIRRWNWIEAELARDGRKPTDATLGELEALWRQAKSQT